MIEKLIATTLQPIIEAEKQLSRRRLMISLLSLGAIALGVLIVLATVYDWWSWLAVFGVFAGLALTALIGFSIIKNRSLNTRKLARKVEQNHPELRSALLAALDQQPDKDGELNYLQKRLLGDVTEHALANQWVRNVSEKRLIGAAWGQFGALIAFCLTTWLLLGQIPERDPFASAPSTEDAVPEASEVAEVAVQIVPGDVEIEKGSRLVVEATFTDPPPALAMLEINPVNESVKGRRIPMQLGLDDTVFSALIPEVNADSTYEVTFSEQSSNSYNITTFEYPLLLQADATITPPAYLNEEVKSVTDTMKVTVMEGSTIDWSLQVNKPLEAAELYSESGESIPLVPNADEPTLLTASMTPKETERYRVHLIDSDERSNKRPPWIKVTVKRNLPPKLKLLFPGQDFKVSAVQELPMEAEVWDDVGVKRAGLSYQVNGEDTELVLSEAELAGKKSHPLETLINLEPLDLEARDLIAYHFWAEDVDRNGEVRRTTSDQFFAQVRFFEEIVREGQPQSGQGEGEENESGKTLELQKEVVNATWKLMRDRDLKKPFEHLESDIDVVRESQFIVYSKVEEQIQQVQDAKLKEILLAAQEIMKKAGDQFALVLESKDSALLDQAHTFALEAMAKLVEATQREMEVSLSNSKGSGKGSPKDQELSNLELEQKELKYEEESRAEQATQSAEQKENLEVLVRLKELARRQEAIAEKIKELEQALQDAGEEEKEEIQRQLKRLQEEQKELLRELDDLGERMDSEQNRPNMTEEREELEETRENVQEASEKLDEGKLADAANAATRAQEQLEEMKEEFRERTSNRFSKEMESVRNAARQLANNQDEIGEALEEMVDQAQSDATDRESQLERGELATKLSQQERALEGLLEEMKELSEQSEVSEPLLSDALYESVREAMTSGAQEALEEASQYTFYNRPEQARPAEEAAARGIEALKEGVEAAAEKVLGNEADALRLARSELDGLIEQAEAEKKRLAGSQETDAEGGAPAEGESEEGSSEKMAGNGQSQPGEEKPGEEGGGEQGSQPGEGEGEEVAENESGQGSGKGEQPKPGEGQGESESENGQVAESGKGKGKGQKGKGPGEGEGQGQEGQVADSTGSGQQPGQGQQGQAGDPTGSGQQPGEGQGKGKGKGRQEGEGSQDQEGSLAEHSPGSNGGGSSSFSNTGDDRNGSMNPGGQLKGGLFFNQSSEETQPGPITGEDYGEWADRLSRIEEMLPQADLRNELSQVLDDARAMRIDFRRDNAAPEAATIQKRITNPLLELRQRISEELAKMNRDNPIAPIDRDAVPSEFRDLVRRYYEELGAGK